LLDTRGKHRFFQVTHDNGHDCYAVGNADELVWPIGILTCNLSAPYFPAPTVPLLDLSLSGADRQGEAIHFIRVEGIAADGISAVLALDATGKVVQTIPVVRNLYSANVPAAAVTIQAVDSAGNVLATVP
jgi:hypothetical protein